MITDKLKESMYWRLLLAACLVLYVVFLASTPFNTRGEPREAVVAMSMLDDGNWILPVNNGDEIAFKPPLLHWSVAALSAVTGSVSEFTSRLPSALAATAMVLATFFFFARRKDERTALMAALITLTNFEVHRGAMTCRVDMLLSALMVLALYALYRWGERGLRGVPVVGILCLAGAALTKGPVGIVLPCAAVALHLLLLGKKGFFTLFWKFALVAIASLVPLLLWYVAAYHEPHGGERFLQLIYEENILRFTGKMTYASHINPWPYNVQTVLSGMLPYSLLFVFALPIAFKAFWRNRSALALSAVKQWKPLAALRKMNEADVFAGVSFATIFIFYCIPASKRSVYLLPLYPFVSYFTARLLLWLAREHRGIVNAFAYTLTGITVLVALVFFCVQMGFVPESIFSGKHAAENVAFLQALRDDVTIVGYLLLLFTLLVAFYLVQDVRRRAWWSVGLTFALFLSLDGAYLPPIMNVKTDRPIAEHIKNIAPTGTIYSFRTDVLEANRMHPFTINFYLGNRIIPIDKAEVLPQEGLLVVGNDEVVQFLEAYPNYEVELLLDTDHRSCDDKKRVKLYRFAGS